jgi:hypothetical protein
MRPVFILYYNKASIRFTTAVPIPTPSLKPYPSTPVLGERIHALPWGTQALPHRFFTTVFSDPSPWSQFHTCANFAFIEALNQWMMTERYKHLNGPGVDGVLVSTGTAVELKTGTPQSAWGAQARRHLRFYPALAVVCLNPHAYLGNVPTIALYK